MPSDKKNDREKRSQTMSKREKKRGPKKEREKQGRLLGITGQGRTEISKTESKRKCMLQAIEETVGLREGTRCEAEYSQKALNIKRVTKEKVGTPS